MLRYSDYKTCNYIVNDFLNKIYINNEKNLMATKNYIKTFNNVYDVEERILTFYRIKYKNRIIINSFIHFKACKHFKDILKGTLYENNYKEILYMVYSSGITYYRSISMFDKKNTIKCIDLVSKSILGLSRILINNETIVRSTRDYTVDSFSMDDGELYNIHVPDKEDSRDFEINTGVLPGYLSSENKYRGKFYEKDYTDYKIRLSMYISEDTNKMLFVAGLFSSTPYYSFIFDLLKIDDSMYTGGPEIQTNF